MSIVKVGYPLKQGLNYFTLAAPALDALVKVGYPLKQGLNK